MGMTMRRTLLLVVASLGAGFVANLGACFIESTQPGTFRFECSASDDCYEGEVCSDGLCQQPCGAGQEACENGTICLNGFCSSLCPVNQDVCPSPQECVALSDAEDEEADATGICTIACDDADHPCAEGQLCLAGLCATQCVSGDECGSGEACTELGPGLSVCVPSGGGGGGFP